MNKQTIRTMFDLAETLNREADEIDAKHAAQGSRLLGGFRSHQSAHDLRVCARLLQKFVIAELSDRT